MMLPMSIVDVAKLVGTSNATVSRVINRRGGVSPETARAVRKAMKEIGFVPSERRPGPKPNSKRAPARKGQVALLINGEAGHANPSSGFGLLLQGIEAALAEAGMRLNVVFASDVAAIPSALEGQRPDGLLLMGEPPVADAESMYRQLPVVWLMANRTRPHWGDHVLPDSEAIGQMAARYLLARGHRELAFVNVGHAAWFFDARAEAFEIAARETAAKTEVLAVPDAYHRSLAGAAQHDGARRAVLDKYLALSPRPTGLFVADDCQALWMHSLLLHAGLKPGKDVELISCNNETVYLQTLQPRPATMDIRFELIGQSGVEQLLRRIASPGFPGRVIMQIEPALITP